MHRPGLVLRETVLNDVPKMALIMEQASAARKSEPLPTKVIDPADLTYLEERLSRVGAWSVLATMDSEVVGFVAGNPVKDLAEQSVGAPESVMTEDLGLIMVSPQCWGLGIGQKLLDWSADFHRVQGKQRLELWTQEENLRARSLYERLGYVLTGETKIRAGEAMVRYRLSLSGR